MKISIAQKLVFAFVGLTLLVLTATLGLARWSFEQGFLDYVNSLEQVRLEHVRDELAEAYAAAGDEWDFLTERRFASLVYRSVPRQATDGSLPPAGVAGRRPPPDRMAGPPGPARQGLPPTALYGPDGQLLVGAQVGLDNVVAIRVPIIVDGKVVGELRSEPRRHIITSLETAFSRQQLNTSWVLGVSSLILAFGLSLLLARGLLAPVRRMIDAVAQLSRGDYFHRISESRSDELGQLVDDINRLGTTLQANQSSRKRLLADVSHELRTPLTVLSGELEALRDGVRRFDVEQLDSLDQEVQRLRYLVDDLYELSVSDVGGLRYQFAAVDVSQSLHAAVESVSKRAATQGIELSLESGQGPAADVTIAADGKRIHQLLMNLLENSLAYTDEPGRVIVRLTRSKDSVLITIDDTSPGVESDDCEQLFDPLYRTDASRTRRTGGAGLGLAICRNIVAAHDGSIAAAPAEAGGLSIRIELPLSGEHCR